MLADTAVDKEASLVFHLEAEPLSFPCVRYIRVEVFLLLALHP